MSHDEYINYWTKECPMYLRLSEAAAEKKWQIDLQVLSRE